MKKETPTPNVILSRKNNKAVTIQTGEKWYVRIWYIISNPFTYIFKGRLRF